MFVGIPRSAQTYRSGPAGSGNAHPRPKLRVRNDTTELFSTLVCLDRFDGDACILDAEGALDDIQVGVAAGSMTLVTFRGARQHGALGQRI